MISIIIPVYNEEKNISNICSDLMKQTLQDFELLIVDDGSTDSTLDILYNIQKENPDLSIQIFQQNHGGVSQARNTGLQHAKGEYVGFIDGDDRVEEDYLEYLWKQANLYQLDWVYCARKTFVNGQLISINKSFPQDVVYKEGQIREELIPLIFCTQDKRLDPLYYSTSCLIKKEILDNNNIQFNPEVVLGEDVIFNLELAAHAQSFSYMCQPKYEYCLSSSSVTWQYRPNRLEEVRLLCKALVQTDHRIGIKVLSEQLRYTLGTLSDVFRAYIDHPESKLNYAQRKKEYQRFENMLEQDPYVNVVWNALNYKELKGKGGQLRYFLFKHRLYECFRLLLKLYRLKEGER